MIRTLIAASLMALLPAVLEAQDHPAPEVSFSATVLMNGFYTSGKTNNSDLPQVAVRRDASDSFPTDGVGATLRQTRVQAKAFAAGTLGGEFSALVDVDFFGGQQPSTGGRTFPLLRIRRAFARMSWDRIHVLAGQEAPPIVELNPSSIASIGFSSLSGSGNLWLWIPQLRVQGDLNGGEGARVYLEGTVLAPTGNTAQGAFLTQPDRAEQSKRPYLQGRVGVRWTQDGLPGEVSLGGHLGWLSTSGDSLLDSRAGAVMLQLPLGKVVEIRGEAFTGKAIAGLGGGAIGQNLGVNGVPVRTTGGWGQLLVRPAPQWELGGSYGIDDPKDADLDPATSRLKNQTFAGELVWRPSPLVIGLEYRHIATTYTAGQATADHLNLALGAEF